MSAIDFETFIFANKTWCFFPAKKNIWSDFQLERAKKNPSNTHMNASSLENRKNYVLGRTLVIPLSSSRSSLTGCILNVVGVTGPGLDASDTETKRSRLNDIKQGQGWMTSKKVKVKQLHLQWTVFAKADSFVLFLSSVKIPSPVLQMN